MLTTVGHADVTSRFSASLQLWVSGHSLGAVLATLAAADFAKEGYQPVVSPRVGDTLGSPRVGDRDWQKL